MSEQRIADLEARVQELISESQGYEERLQLLEESQKSVRSRALRIRIVLLTILVGAFIFLRFGGLTAF